MLRISMRVNTAFENLENIEISMRAKRRAAAAGTKTALEYMRHHSPVRTGRVRASWKPGTQRKNPKATPKGFRINRESLRIFMENDAHEMRPGGAHYYAQYPEYGFYHVGQGRYHPGRDDRFGAASAAAEVIRAVLVEEIKKDLAASKPAGESQ